MPGELQAHGRFSRTLLAENDRRRRLRGIAIDLVPRGMVRALDAELFEDRISLSIFLGKRIAGDAVVIEKLLNFHGRRNQSKVRGPKSNVMVIRPDASDLGPRTLDTARRRSFHFQALNHVLKSLLVLVDSGFRAVELEEVVSLVFGLNNRAEHTV